MRDPKVLRACWAASVDEASTLPTDHIAASSVWIGPHRKASHTRLLKGRCST